MLILTSKPRIFYVNTMNTIKYKGSIPWTLTSPIQCTALNKTKFDIHLADNSRIYHINDKSGGSERWVTAITTINETWSSYFRLSLGVDLATDDYSAYSASTSANTSRLSAKK